MRLLAAAVLSFMLLHSGPILAQGLNETQKKEIEALIGDYIRRNPEVILESVRTMQERDQVAQMKRQQDELIARRREIENDPASPVVGNPKGKVTVTEFFDYRCGYCKSVLPAVQKLLKDDADVRYVMKELPILSVESRLAAKLALVVWKTEPKRYLDLHAKLMGAQGEFSEKRIYDLARSAGVDVERAKREMESPAIEQALDANMQLAQALGINGTPGFVIGNRLLPGAVDYDTLKKLVDETRRGS